MGDERLEELLVVADLVQDGQGGRGDSQAVAHSGKQSQPPVNIFVSALL